MSRKRQDASTVRISDEEYCRLENKFETLRNEVSPATKRKHSHFFICIFIYFDS